MNICEETKMFLKDDLEVTEEQQECLLKHLAGCSNCKQLMTLCDETRLFFYEKLPFVFDTERQNLLLEHYASCKSCLKVLEKFSIMTLTDKQPAFEFS